MREVIDQLWIGNAIDARDVTGVLGLGVAAIVDLAIEEPPIQYPRDVVYCRFPLIDGSGNQPAVLRAAIETTATFVATGTPNIVGSVTFEAGNFRRVSHRGNLGLAVVREWRRRGVGTALLKALLEWVETSPAIEKVCLDVFGSNEPATRLYEKLGFIEEGRRARDIKRGPDDYVDTVMMYRFVKQGAHANGSLGQ